MARLNSFDQSADARDLSDIEVQNIRFHPRIDYQGHGWKFPMRFRGDTLEAAAKAGDALDPQYTTHKVTSSTDQKLLEVHLSIPTEIDQSTNPSQVLVIQCGQDFKYRTLLPRLKVAREAWPDSIIVILPSRRGRGQDMTYVRDCLDQLRFLYRRGYIMRIHNVIFYLLSFGNSIGMYALSALEATGKIFSDGIIMDSPPIDLVRTLRFWNPTAPLGEKALTKFLSRFAPARDQGLLCTTRRDCLKASELWRTLEQGRPVRTPVWVIKSVHDRKARPGDADDIFKAINTGKGDVTFMTSACASHTQFGYFAPFKTLFVNFIEFVRLGTQPESIKVNQGLVVVTPKTCPIHSSKEYESTRGRDPARVVSV